MSPGTGGLWSEHPEVRALLIASQREAFRQGHAWIGEEARLYRQPWGFRLRDIACPRVELWWHGARDRNVPIAMGRYVARSIPGCRATFYRTRGTPLPLRHMPEILRAMTPS